jgi:acetolactate synthase-1/2/3 large subunit
MSGCKADRYFMKPEIEDSGRGDYFAAQAYLEHLSRRGVDYLFGNGGTDFAPINEAISRARRDGGTTPIPVLVPHENIAMGMAYGYTLVTGRPQAVMVHTSVGTANCINNLFNASRERIPMLLTAGRTPILEKGMPGSRNNYINWAQEMFDQGGMVRELVKWDYELRHPSQVHAVVDRALSLAQSEPKGPVYLVLPREVLAAPCERVDAAREVEPVSQHHPDPAAVGRLAQWIREAEHPLIITADAGRCESAFHALDGLARRLAIPVVEYRPRFASLPTDNPMHAGWESGELLAQADLVLVLDCDVPWIPAHGAPRPDAKVVHAGPDPLFASYPLRGFRSDLTLQCEAGILLRALDTAIGALEGDSARQVQARYERVAARNLARVKRGTAAGDKMTNAWLTRCISEIRDEDTILVNEYSLAFDELLHRKPGTFFTHSPAGGLGWAAGASLGIRLAAKDKTVITVTGDGAYLFGNPTPAHMVSRTLGLPVLWVVYNNSRWGAVHRATLSMYPDGAAAQDPDPPFTNMGISPDFEKIVQACGGHGERVEDPAELPAALRRCLDVVRREGRQALLNVIAAPDL